MKKQISLFALVGLLVFLLTHAAAAEEYLLKDFASEEMRTIVNAPPESTGTGVTAKRKARVVFGIGDLGRFRKGNEGIYKNLDYEFTVNPLGYLEIHAILAGGLALGGGGTVIYSKNNGVTTFQWGVGPSLYYYFNMKGKVRPFLGFKYIYGVSSVETTDAVLGEITLKNTIHSLEGTGGIVFMASTNFGIYLGYSFVHDYVETDTNGLKGKDEGNYHKAGLGFKIFL